MSLTKKSFLLNKKYAAIRTDLYSNFWGADHSGVDVNFPETKAVLVDFIHPQIIDILQKCDWVLFMEKGQDENDIIRDYKVTIRRVEKNMLTDGLK